jgi:lipopolysaccharide export system permease protein
MIKIVDRYLLKETIPPFLVGIGVFTFIILMSQFLRLIEMILNKGVPVFTALRLIAHLLPSILVMTVPMAVLLATLVAFGRLSADNELTALRGGKLSLHRLAVPVIALALVIYAFDFYLVASALPSSNQAFRRLMLSVLRSKATIGLQEKIFNSDYDGLIIYINEIPSSSPNPVMKGIIIHDNRPDQENRGSGAATIFAEEGKLIDDGAGGTIFRLRNGSIHSMKSDRRRYQLSNFALHDLNVMPTGEAAGETILPKGLREMSIGELRAKVTELRAARAPVFPPLVEIHKKFALPFACIIFAVLGIALGVIVRRGEKMVAFAVCIAVVVVYYIFMVAGEPMGKKGIVPPWIAVWFPNVLFLGLTAVTYARAATEGHLFARIRGRIIRKR